MNTTQDTIKVRGRDFQLSITSDKHDAKRYILTGKRGAIYGTMRHSKHPQVMFLTSARSLAPCTLGEVWFTDIDGQLEPIRGWYTNREGALVVQR